MGFPKSVLVPCSRRAQELNQPENQVQPFHLLTPDGERLYGWHIVPIGLYAHNDMALLEGPTGPAANATHTPAFTILKRDPNARLVISCKCHDS